MVILYDGREQINDHILEYFDKNKIAYQKKALKTGDYTFKLSTCPELGINRDFFFDELCIERKNSVSELAGNFTEKDGRILREFSRMACIPNCYVLIENDRIEDVLDGNYQSKLNPESFIRSLLTVQKRSNFYLYFVQREYMGKFIYEICRNVLDNAILK